jgi:Leucine-rich repeat (LRR) protein
MKTINTTDRLLFLAEQFDIFELSDIGVGSITNTLNENGYETKTITTPAGVVIALLSIKPKPSNPKFILTKVSVSSDVFASMVDADPTENKMYLQWMLNVFTRLIKQNTDSSVRDAIMFVSEDLPQANEYLILFAEHKRKKKFKELCNNAFSLKDITDPTDINQYKNLSELFDAVDPFFLREPSSVERTMNKYVDGRQALIPYKDRKYTVYVPLTVTASSVFSNFANWCTTRDKNGMFANYTTNHKRPDNLFSKLFIVINNKFFNGDSEEIYQIHFETNQIKDRTNKENVDIYSLVLSEDEALRNFFYLELIGLAKAYKSGLDTNPYLKMLVSFGYTESLFEIIDSNTSTIRFIDRSIPRLPDISTFQNLDQLIISKANLHELHPSIGSLEKLEILILCDNKIKTLPNGIGKLKNLLFLNINNNPINYIPDDIANLDISNGGSLGKITVSISDIGKDNYDKLQRLLPTTRFE